MGKAAFESKKTRAPPNTTRRESVGPTAILRIPAHCDLCNKPSATLLLWPADDITEEIPYMAVCAKHAENPERFQLDEDVPDDRELN